MSGGIEDLETEADGIRNWTCVGWTQDCTDGASVMSCSWNGGHTYHISNNSNDLTNFGLEVAWNFMSQFNRVPPKSSRDGAAALFRGVTSSFIVGIVLMVMVMS